MLEKTGDLLFLEEGLGDLLFLDTGFGDLPFAEVTADLLLTDCDLFWLIFDPLEITDFFLF